MASGGRTKSTQPAATALRGMPSYLADFSSCAKVMPPADLMASSPRVPSDAVPDRTTPIARLPASSAREPKKWSIGMPGIVVFRRATRWSTPPLMLIVVFGGIT